MSRDIANRFIEALERLERERDLETIVSLFAEDCRVGNVIVPAPYEGPPGAREFWERYRETFGDVKSTFHNIIVTGGHAALEWTTEGINQNGSRIKYDGVSLLDIEGGRITRFHAYFDSRLLSQQVLKDAVANN
jgi:ketosteroid isomerase-like protein